MRNISKSKKGVIEVQFGWVFVLVVGVIILLFFIGIVKSTSKSSTESKYVDLKGSLKTLMSQSETDVGTTRTIGMPAIALEFTCTGFNIKDSKSSPESTPYKTFFSPNIIKGREMITYSKYWDMPYKVDYFVYITSKQMRYNFINDTSCNLDPICKALFSRIIKELPANITYNVVPRISDVKENNYDKERFILLSSDSISQTLDSSLNSMKDEDVTAVVIVRSSSSSGEVQYYKKSGSSFKKTNTSLYLGFPMLLGAIISEDSLYKCNVDKSLKKFKIISEIYLNRTQYLINYYSAFDQKTRCYDYYDGANSDLTIILGELSKSNPDFPNIEERASEEYGLGYRNENLMYYSCPMIY